MGQDLSFSTCIYVNFVYVCLVSTSMEDVDWDELLPQRQWRRYDTRTWEEFMPPPSQQLAEVLPAGWGKLFKPPTLLLMHF